MEASFQCGNCGELRDFICDLDRTGICDLCAEKTEQSGFWAIRINRTTDEIKQISTWLTYVWFIARVDGTPILFDTKADAESWLETQKIEGEVYLMCKD